MKMISVILFLMIFGIDSQESILPKNEEGLIHFEGLVHVENLNKDALFNNAINYVSPSNKKRNKSSKDLSINPEKQVIQKKGNFFVYTQGLITPQVHGEITYNIYIQVFEDGYKYTFTNFVFNYYQRNRYGRYARVSGKYKYLEEEKFAGMQKTWTNHKLYTKEFVESQIHQLKNKMSELPPGAKTAQNLESESQSQ
ncbi:MAG: DUF4468 domain-containing protein [Bacteroidota bacterium]|nr:DUF4468 domain-containing protein [Bacteroidota bacterium]